MRRKVALVLVFVGSLPVRAADDFERPPVNYSKATPNNEISRLQQRLDKDEVRLDFDKTRGYLPALLSQLGIGHSSQVLVFSKTSLQRSRISPATPRALYFNDHHYIGYCQDGAVLEISTVDPELGAVFYTLDQDEEVKPRFVRQTDACLLCHGSSQTRGVPGHLVRSVFPDSSGSPILSWGSYRIDQSTPLERRWGGWYVTGQHGKQTHLGNFVALKSNREPNAEQILKFGGLNQTDLKERFDVSAYLTPHSDIVALMVLEHQAEMHNLLTRAQFQVRAALHEQESLNKALNRGDDYRSDSTYRRIWNAAEPLVNYLFFGGEAKLTDRIIGSSSFAADFAKQGPRDRKGRSLRDLDLQTRLFKYPCSYLIYSPSFDALHPELKTYVLKCLHDVLTGRHIPRQLEHLTAADRRAILEILLDTKDDLPGYWRSATPR